MGGKPPISFSRGSTALIEFCRCFSDMIIESYSNDLGKSLAKIHRHSYTFIRAPSAISEILPLFFPDTSLKAILSLFLLSLIFFVCGEASLLILPRPVSLSA